MNGRRDVVRYEVFVDTKRLVGALRSVDRSRSRALADESRVAAT